MTPVFEQVKKFHALDSMTTVIGCMTCIGENHDIPHCIQHSPTQMKDDLPLNNMSAH
jgi:hypothetical protein